MSIRFSGGERFQRGRGIGGLLQLAKGLFKPAIESIGRVVRSNTGQAIGNALKNQAIDTAKNLATDVLTGNNLKEGVKREVHNIKTELHWGFSNWIKSRRLNVENQRDKVRKFKIVNREVREKQK